MEHREVKTPEQIAELKKRSPGGYRNLRESVINELPEENLFRTPSAIEGGGGANSAAMKKAKNRFVMLRYQVADLSAENGLQVPEVIQEDYKNYSLMPTPAVGHIRNHDEPIEDYVARRQKMLDGEYKGMPGVSLGVAVRMNWGKFAPAIQRWEELTRPAPAPTKPDGQDGNHRLSAEFTEWMMGLPEGWVTAEDIGIKRNDQLKACGNGVVPQQAELALRILLKDVQI
jgi:site-specific DNA-cytosine methylase